MRKISEIFCDLIFCHWEIHCVEHIKMDEFDKGFTMDSKVVAYCDKRMRVRSEERKGLFNEMNEVLATIIKEKKYNFKLEN